MAKVHRHHHLPALLGAVLLAALPAFAGAQAITLNEIRIDQPSTDNDEYFELAGPAGSSLDGLTYVVIGDGTGGTSGVVEAVVPLTGLSVGASGLFVAAEGTFSLGTPDLFANLNFENSDNVTHLLVDGFSGANGDDLDSDDDGTLDVTPWTAVIDCLALVESVSSGEQTYCATSLGPDGSFVPGHAFLCPAGWEIGTFDPVGATDTPGAANACGPALVDVELSEIRIDQPSSDLDEFFELTGNPGDALDGLTYLVIGDGTGASGVVEAVVNLSGQTMPASGFFVAAEGTFTLGTADFTASLNFENSDNVTHLVVRDFTGANGNDLDTDDDGTLDSTPWTEIVDCVALIESVGSGDQTYCADDVGPDGSFVPGQAFDCPAGWQIGSFSPGTTDTPGAANACPIAADVELSEIRIDQPSSDVDEYFELAGTPGGGLDGLTYLVIGDGSGGSGTVEAVVGLAGQAIPASGFFVAAEGSFSLGTADFTANLNFENSDNVTHLLVRDFSGSNGNDLDTDDDGTLDVTPWAAVVDCVALIESVGSGDLTYCADTAGPDGNFVPAHALDCPFGWQVGPFTPTIDTPGAANDCAPISLVVNEVDYDQPSTDTAEFVEIKNDSSGTVNLDPFALTLVNGNGTSIYQTVNLPDVELGPGEYYVVCANAATVMNCDLDALSSIQNGAPDAVAITFDGAVVDTVSYEGDTGAPYTETTGAGLSDSGSSSQAFKSISRLPDGTDTDHNANDFARVCITPGGTNTSVDVDCTELGPLLEIFEIQGSDLASPFAGAPVKTESNVVTALGLDGFFLQTPTERTDGDIDTSDGIFVFTGGTPGVAVGELVDVGATIVESFGFTRLESPTVTVVGTGTVPAPVAFNASTPSPDPIFPSCAVEYECYEGMLISIAQGTVTGPNQGFGGDPIAEVFVTASSVRTFREPGIEFPGLPGRPDLPVWDGNPEVFELDPDKLGLPNQTILGGSTFSATGVLGFEFFDYELWPTVLDVVPATLPGAVRARAQGEITVGSLNLFRLFDNSSTELARRVDKFSAYIREVLDAPDVLGVQEAENLGVLEELAAAISRDDIAYQAFLVEGNDIGGIDVGFLVRDTILVDAVTQLGAGEILEEDGSLLHDRPPLLLEGRCSGGGFPFAVMVNHTRSLNSIDTSERVRRKRLAQAQSIAAKVQAFQTAQPDVPLVLIGDYNAFEFTDGFADVIGQIAGDFDPADSQFSGADLVDPNLTIQVLSLPPEERYSFIFDGNAQVLDHALTSAAADPWVRGFEYGRGNADAAEELIEDGTTFLRSSDHDGFVLYLLTDCDGDGVPDDVDVCLGTVIPEGVPTDGLGINRWALVDDDLVFDTTLPPGVGPDRSYTTEDTAGCSCEQIIEAQGLGQGHVNSGCSISAMDDWVALVNP